MSEERAALLMHAAGTGVVQALLSEPEDRRDMGLAKTAREAVIAAICGAPPAPATTGVGGAARALRASLDETSVLSAGERLLLDELLARIANAAR